MNFSARARYVLFPSLTFFFSFSSLSHFSYCAVYLRFCFSLCSCRCIAVGSFPPSLPPFLAALLPLPPLPFTLLLPLLLTA